MALPAGAPWPPLAVLPSDQARTPSVPVVPPVSVIGTPESGGNPEVLVVVVVEAAVVVVGLVVLELVVVVVLAALLEVVVLPGRMLVVVCAAVLVVVAPSVVEVVSAVVLVVVVAGALVVVVPDGFAACTGGVAPVAAELDVPSAPPPQAPRKARLRAARARGCIVRGIDYLSDVELPACLREEVVYRHCNVSLQRLSTAALPQVKICKNFRASIADLLSTNVVRKDKLFQASKSPGEVDGGRVSGLR